MFVVTKHIFCCDKSMLVATKVTKLCLSRERFCCDKTFVATKMILGAAPANDNRLESPMVTLAWYGSKHRVRAT